MAVLIEELLQLLAGRAPAVSWAPEWMPSEILVWADNIFLVSSSIADTMKRTQEIAYVFGKRDLRFNQSSFEILPSKTAEREATRILLNEGMELSWVRILVVLGCYLHGSGSTETQVKGRLGQERKMFGKLRPMLCCPRILEEGRIKTFCTTVASSVLWGWGCWIPSTKTQQLISVQETRWLRCMLGGRKAQDVPWVDWFRTTKTLCAGVKMQVEPSVSVAQSLGGCVWMGGTRGSERRLPSWACCNSVAKR